MKSWIKKLDSSFVRFCIIGVVNTVIGMLIMFGMYNLLKISYWISTASNYILVSILSYFLNKYFTFKNYKKSWMQVFKFALNIIVCYFLAYGVAKPLAYVVLKQQSENVRNNIAMLVGMVLFTFLNYFGQKFFAFSYKKTETR